MAAAKGKGLTQQQKVWLIQQFAVFAGTPTEIAEAFEKEFKRSITRQIAWHYEASKPAVRAKLSKQLLDIFDDARKAFLNDTTSIAIANKAWRLNELFDHYREAKRKGNRGLARELLEQAAKEAGDAFSNRREITGAGGGPIETKEIPFDLSKLTAAERDDLERLSVKMYGRDSASA